MAALNNKFSKSEKLTSKKDIEALFSQGLYIDAPPIKAVVLPKDRNSGILISVGVSVPKKKVKLAVNRNLIKRRIKEAYRLNNHDLKANLKNDNKELNIMFVYASQQILSYKEIEGKIKVILTRLIE